MAFCRVFVCDELFNSLNSVECPLGDDEWRLAGLKGSYEAFDFGSLRRAGWKPAEQVGCFRKGPSTLPGSGKGARQRKARLVEVWIRLEGSS